MKKYSVVIIGAGQIGARYDMPDKKHVLSHAHAFSADDRFDLVGIIDPNEDVLKEACDFWKATGYSSLDEAYGVHNSFDVVINASPDTLHFDILNALITYECKVIITEKPVTLSKAKAEYLFEQFNLHNKQVILNHSRRFIDYYQEIKAQIDDAHLGEFISGTGYYGKGLLHNGTHMLDLLYYFLGKPEKIMQLDSIADFSPEDKTKTLTIEYPNRTFFMMNGINSNIVSIFEFELLFSKARLKFLNSGYEIEFYAISNNNVHSGYQVYNKSRTIKINPSSAMEGLAQNVFDVLNGSNPKCGIRDGIKVLEIWEKLKSE